jgi:iron complex outermembrane recepter protein
VTQRVLKQDTLFRLSPVAAGAAVLVMALSAQAQTQPGPSTQTAEQAQAEKEKAEKEKAEKERGQVQTITVTGIRRAIESAISVKRNADSIVEAISSEDLGKLPEPSVADAMARLPGVAAQRNKNSGKAQSISVRGMSPDFNGALLNGREVASSGDSRGVDFDLYPAELLNQLTVYKTPHAGLLGQGLSSTIDMRTIRPLNASGRAVAVNFRDQKTGIGNGIENGEGGGDRLSLSYVDQFLDRTLGVAFGAVRFKEEGAAQVRVNTWGGWTPQLNYTDPSTGTVRRVGVPGGFGRDLEFSDQERKGLMGVLQWKPNKNFETTLDVFQSKGRQANFKKGIEGFIGGDSSRYSTYRTSNSDGSAPTLSNATVITGVCEQRHHRQLQRGDPQPQRRHGRRPQGLWPECALET